MAFDPSEPFTVVSEPEDASGFDPDKPFTVVAEPEESSSVASVSSVQDGPTMRPAIPAPGMSGPSAFGRQMTPLPQAFPAQGQAIQDAQIAQDQRIAKMPQAIEDAKFAPPPGPEPEIQPWGEEGTVLRGASSVVTDMLNRPEYIAALLNPATAVAVGIYFAPHIAKQFAEDVRKAHEGDREALGRAFMIGLPILLGVRGKKGIRGGIDTRMAPGDFAPLDAVARRNMAVRDSAGEVVGKQPYEYIGEQDYFKGLDEATAQKMREMGVKNTQLFNLTEDVPGLGPKGSTFQRETLEKVGFKPETLLKRSDAELKEIIGERIQDAIPKRETETVPVEEPPGRGPTVDEQVRAEAGRDDAGTKTTPDTPQRDVGAAPPEVSEALNRGVDENAAAAAQKTAQQPEIIGMGGAVPSEFAPGSRAMGIKNAAVDAERASRGLEPIMKPAREAHQEVWDRTMAKIDRDPTWQDRLIKELKDRYRNVEPDEILALDHRYVDLKNEYEKARRDAAQAADDGRMEDVAQIEGRIAEWQARLAELELVVDRVGTQWGRSGNMRQRMMLEDFTLEAMERTYRESKGFQPLTDIERAQIKRRHDEMAAKIKELEELRAAEQKQFSESEVNRVMSELRAQVAAAPKYEPRVLQMAERFATTMEEKGAAALARIRERMKNVSSGVDPTLLADLAVVGAAKLTRGAVDFAKWSDAMIRDVGDWIRPHLKEIWESARSLASEKDRPVTEESVTQANRTARSAGAVGGKAITPRYVAETATQGESVLNFGAGRPDKATGRYLHSDMVREKGATVTEYDFGSNQVGALGKEYDTVFASNVLNVQGNIAMLEKTLQQIRDSTKSGGRAVFNYPESPRYLGMSSDAVARAIERAFGSKPVRVGGTSRAPLWEVRKGKSDFLSMIDRQGEEALARLREKLRNVGAGVDPTILADVAIYGAAKITRGLTDSVKWGEEMVRELGEWIRPHLDEAWKAAMKSFETDLDTFSKPIGKAAASVKQAVQTQASVNPVEKITAQIKTAVESKNMEEVGTLAKRLAREFVAGGIKEWQALVKAVHAQIQKIIPEFTERQAMDAISGYGDFTRLSMDEVSVILRDLKGQMQQIAKLEDMAKGEAPKKTGRERRVPSDEERALIRQVNEAKKQGGFNITDPATQLKSSLDARKTYYRNRLADLEREIAKREKTVKTQTKPPTDPELEALKKEYERVRKEHAEMFPRDAELAAIDALEASISEYVRRIHEKDLFPEKPQVLDTPRLRILRNQRDQLMKRIEAMRKAAPETFAKEKARLQKSIDELVRQINEGDIAGTKRAKGASHPELEVLRTERNDLLKIKRQLQNATKPKKSRLEITLDAIKTRLEKDINDLSERLATRTRRPSASSKVAYDAEATALKRRRDELKEQYDAMFPKEPLTPEQRLERWNKHAQRRMAQIRERIARRDFETRKREPIELDKKSFQVELQIEELKRQFNEKVIEQKYARQTKWQKTLRNTVEGVNFSRSLLTSLDVSAVLRQGGFITFAHPLRSAQSLPTMYRALKSKEGAAEVMARIRERENYQLYRKAGLELTEQGHSLAKMEEAFMSRWAEKFGVTRVSQRAYTAFLNKLRADSFDSMVAALSRDSTTGTVSLAEAQIIANYINIATGRGNMAKFQQASVALNTAFFAPRYVASRFQLALGQPIWHGAFSQGKIPFKDTARVRKMIAMEYGRFLVSAGLVYALGKLAGADLELNPVSSDFGKLRVGDTRIDLLGGLQQATVYLARTASGYTKTGGGRVLPIRGDLPYGSKNWFDISTRFLRTKFSPAFGTIVDLATGRDVVEQDVTAWSALTGLVVPISFQDVFTLMEEQGVPRGTALFLLSLFGAGVQTYEDK